MAITKIQKVSSGNIEFRDAGDNLRASLTSSAFAKPIGMQGVEIEDATGSKIQVFSTVVVEMISSAGTVNNPTQQQIFEELANNFFSFNREELCTNNVANTSSLAGANLTEVLNSLGGSTPIYGTYVAFAKEDAETSTNATTAQIKLGLELPSLVAGTYKIESYVEISCDRTTRSLYTQLRLNASVLTQTDKEAKDTTDYVGVSSFDIVNLSGDNSVDITYYSEHTTATVTARRAKILVTRIA